MQYRRDEAFRFDFGEPIPITFNIEELNGNALRSSDGNAKMLDISLHGMKIETILAIPVDSQHEVKVSVHFSLNNREYVIHGQLLWSKQYVNQYQYGINFISDSDTQEAILEDLKQIGKRMAHQ